MSDLVLRTSSKTHVALYNAAQTVVALAHTAAERFRREQTGQDLVEYAGIIVLVAAIIAAIGVSGLGQTIGTDIKNAINSVLNGSGQAAGGGGH
jgi:Flp pilus assembly pilin Flp